MTRRTLLLVGLAAVAAGFALALGPGLVTLDVATAATILVWVAALVGAAFAVHARLAGDRSGARALPRASERPAYGVPGDDLAATVADLGAGERDASARDGVRERLRSTTVDALVRFGDRTRSVARDAVAEGTWTDDSAAVGLFDDEIDGPRGRPEVEAGFDNRVERVAAVLTGDVAGDALDRSETVDRDGDASETRRVRRSDDGPPVRPELDRGEERLERTGRYRGAYGIALAATAVAILAGRPEAILAGLAGVGFAAYGRLWDAPAPALTVERHVSETDPAPGERVRVTLSVTNESDRLLPDLRLCDDVPAGLTVVEGTPRITTALRPGKRAVVEYEVVAVRGRHAFDGVTVVIRDVSGASRRRSRVATDETTVVCRPRYDAATLPLGDLATRLIGRQPVSATGEGVAFHSVREYRPGDALSSVDWNRLARTGDLATRRFDQPRTVTVVLVVDAREPAYVTGDGAERRPAVDACVHAAGALASGSLDANCRVGLAAFSPRDCWVPPSSWGGHRRRLLDRLTVDDAFGWRPPDAGTSDASAGDDSRLADRLIARLPPDAQVVLFSPFADDAPVALAKQLRARGHDVLAASPDSTRADTPFRRVVAAERRLRLDGLRRAGVPVFEWRPDPDPTAVDDSPIHRTAPDTSTTETRAAGHGPLSHVHGDGVEGEPEREARNRVVGAETDDEAGHGRSSGARTAVDGDDPATDIDHLATDGGIARSVRVRARLPGRPRISHVLAVIAAVATLAAFGGWSLAAVAGVAGCLALLAAFAVQSRSAVALAGALLFGATLLATAAGASIPNALVGAFGAVLAADLGLFALGLDGDVDWSVETVRVELLHAVASGVVAVVTAGVGYALFRLGPSAGPVAVVALLLGGVVLASLLR